jgi:N-acetyl-anhydromuramyl-L-alanine amidase AmpD
LKFIRARHYTDVGSPARHIDLVVLHTMEYPELPESAEWCANYFAKPGAPEASAHYLVDADSVVQGVKDEDVAWAAPGANHNGIQIEHAGYAKQTKKDWSDDYSQRMLRRSAKLSARLCRKHRIPVRWISPSQLRSGRRGLTSHANVSAAFKKSSHWDPGPNFPVTAYLALVKAELKPAAREPVIVNTPLEEAIALIEASTAFKDKHPRIVAAWKKLTALRKKK